MCLIYTTSRRTRTDKDDKNNVIWVVVAISIATVVSISATSGIAAARTVSTTSFGRRAIQTPR